MQIVSFEKNLPAFLQSVKSAPQDNELAGYGSTGFGSVSIKGKLFNISRAGETTLLMNPKDPDSPASSIEVVVIKGQKKPSKTWYASSYVEGAEQKAPDCFSNDGERPDAASTKVQSKTCALCPHNQFGSAVSDKGVPGKGKACADVVRLAIAQPDDLENPLLLRVPPASIKGLGEFGKEVAKRGVSPHMVITKISFDPAAPSPKLVFKPIGFVDQPTYELANEMRDSDIVQAILGVASAVPVADNVPLSTQVNEAEVERGITGAPAVSKSKEVSDDEVTRAVSTAELAAKKKADAKEAKRLALAAQMAALEEEENAPADDIKVSGAELNLDSLDFD